MTRYMSPLQYLRPVTVALVLLLAMAGPALGHHAEVTATLDCDYTVHITVTAWEGTGGEDNDASRTNLDIGVWIDETGSGYVELPNHSQYGDFEFTPDNGFTFSLDFDAINTPEVKVKVQAQEDWGNGNDPGQARETVAVQDTECPEPTPTPTENPSPSPASSGSDTGGSPEPTLPPTDTEAARGGGPYVPVALAIVTFAVGMAVGGAFIASAKRSRR